MQLLVPAYFQRTMIRRLITLPIHVQAYHETLQPNPTIILPILTIIRNVERRKLTNPVYTQTKNYPIFIQSTLLQHRQIVLFQTILKKVKIIVLFT